MASTADILLTEQTLIALRFIHEYRYLTVNQVAQVTGLRPKSASEMLLRLERQKLLSHFGNVGVRGYGKTPKVYYLTKRGHALLAEESEFAGEPVSPYKPINVSSRWSPQMYHRIATLDVMMALERGIMERPAYSLPATLIEYRRHKDGNNWIGETTDFVAEPLSSENRIVPDAGFVLENATTGARALFLIEVDLGTETQSSAVAEHVRSSFKHKIEQYDRYLAGGRYRDRYKAWGEFRYFTVLIITNSDGRLRNMRRVLSELPDRLHQYYRLSTLDRVCGNLFHSEWCGRNENDHNTYRLIQEGQNHES